MKLEEWKKRFKERVEWQYWSENPNNLSIPEKFRIAEILSRKHFQAQYDADCKLLKETEHLAYLPSNNFAPELRALRDKAKKAVELHNEYNPLNLSLEGSKAQEMPTHILLVLVQWFESCKGSSKLYEELRYFMTEELPIFLKELNYSPRYKFPEMPKEKINCSDSSRQMNKRRKDWNKILQRRKYLPDAEFQVSFKDSKRPPISIKL